MQTWEHWTHFHEMDWVPNHVIQDCHQLMIDLYWTMFELYQETPRMDSVQKKGYLSKTRKAFRHIQGIESALRQRKVQVDSFEPHLFDKQGKPYEARYKEVGLPPL